MVDQLKRYVLGLVGIKNVPFFSKEIHASQKFKFKSKLTQFLIISNYSLLLTVLTGGTTTLACLERCALAGVSGVLS